jgi:hypothetical protein
VRLLSVMICESTGDWCQVARAWMELLELVGNVSMELAELELAELM